MIYLLGGPPRTGKSILGAQICSAHCISMVSTDSLGAALECLLTPTLEPDLFAFTRFNELPMAERARLMRANPTEFLNYCLLESRVIWRAAKAFISKEQLEGRDVLIEGVAVLPELAAQLQNIAFRAVFIGNHGSDLIDNIRQSAKENRHDWMKSMSDEYIEAFAVVVRQMSTFIQQEAKRFGFQYLELDQKPFPDLPRLIMQCLGLPVLQASTNDNRRF